MTDEQTDSPSRLQNAFLVMGLSLCWATMLGYVNSGTFFLGPIGRLGLDTPLITALLVSVFISILICYHATRSKRRTPLLELLAGILASSARLLLTYGNDILASACYGAGTTMLLASWLNLISLVYCSGKSMVISSGLLIGNFLSIIYNINIDKIIDYVSISMPLLSMSLFFAIDHPIRMATPNERKQTDISNAQLKVTLRRLFIPLVTLFSIALISTIMTQFSLSSFPPAERFNLPMIRYVASSIGALLAFCACYFIQTANRNRIRVTLFVVSLVPILLPIFGDIYSYIGAAILLILVEYLTVDTAAHMAETSKNSPKSATLSTGVWLLTYNGHMIAGILVGTGITRFPNQSIVAQGVSVSIFGLGILVIALFVLAYRRASLSSIRNRVVHNSNLSLETRDRVVEMCQVAGIEYHLTEREREILPFLLLGFSDDSIAQKLILQKSTVRTHIRGIYKKIGVHSRAELKETIIR